ncbi:MAG: hypothetical protein GWO20_14335, partial [Candidatus Korarchaeota archaeon]|nr:hypothetical protein [Candidatus Korarchaeota archaeon]
ASVVFPSKSSEANALLLAESIHAFAGSLSQAPVWFFMPEYGKQLSENVKDKLLTLNVALRPFKVDNEILQFPFGAYILAAALAESTICNQTNLLAW